jgi:hypothetical protein
MAVTINGKKFVTQSIAPAPQLKADLLPWEEDPESPSTPPESKKSILEALAAFNPKGKDKLFLVNLKTGVQFKVVSWDTVTAKAVLTGDHGLRLNPLITTREDEKYFPLWRKA